MPWKETCRMKERVKFILEWERGRLSMACLCRKYGISRQTGYKWVRRYQEMGCCVEALTDLSRVPHSHPWKTSVEMEDLVIRARKHRPQWGPRTLYDWLTNRFPDAEIPAPSTIGRILKRNGLSKARHRRRRTPPSDQPLGAFGQPNGVWTADFKGHFKMGNGVYCYPLTIMDAYSRFLLRCEGLTHTSAEDAWPIFESAFVEYGLPDAIRTDNGSPFASRGAGGLTSLSAKWIKLKIVHERIEPGHPEQNGRHERMHRTLKHEAITPPRASLRAQQRAFDQFRKRYNEERPHQAHKGKPPGAIYLASQRVYPENIPSIEYPWDSDVVQLDKQGRAKIGRHIFYVSKTLAYEDVLIEPIDNLCWEVYFGNVMLGYIDANQSKRELLPPRRGWRQTVNHVVR